ncbi:hypothetical protein [Sphingobacterium detergens]
MMRHLAFSTLLLLLLTGCRVYYPNHTQLDYKQADTVIQNSYFADLHDERLYRATIRFYKKEFSGMFVAKRINQHEHRIVLTSDLGNTLFDMTIAKDKHQVNYIMQDLNKKIIINTLVKDFRTLTQVNYPITYQDSSSRQFLSTMDGKRYFLDLNDQGKLAKIETASKYKPKLKIQLSTDSIGKLDKFSIQHHGIKLQMDFVNIPF